jgi:hypothetical protein
VFEVICEYPVTAPELATDVKALGLAETSFRIRGVDEDSESPLVEPTETSFLADSEYKDLKIKHKDYFGDDFNKSFLKDLDKAAKARKKEGVQTEYKLPKGKTDKNGTKSALGS